MSKFWEEYKVEIMQTIALLFFAIMLIYGVVEMSDEYKRTKENYNEQLREINIKLDKIQMDLDVLNLQLI